MKQWLVFMVIIFIGCDDAVERNLTISEIVSLIEESINENQLSNLNPYFSKKAKIYEQGSIDDSWEHYRDGHLGQEIMEFESFDFSLEIAESYEKEQMAFVRGFYNLEAVIKGKPISSKGLVTLTLVKDELTWNIIHLQFSRSCR